MDLTINEFMSLYSGYKTQQNQQLIIQKLSNPDQKVDWRQKQAVTKVKNQGQCQSSWAFSVIGAIEGIFAIKNQQQKEFSQQALVDCSGNGNQGCNGGITSKAFEWIQQNGIPSDQVYSYKGDAGNCQYYNPEIIIKSFFDVSPQNHLQLISAITQQPVSVAINANSQIFQFYKQGIIKFNCDINLNHAVLAVGYDVDLNGQEYYILKNSWGQEWGQNGYFYLARDSKTDGPGMCGIQTQAIYPLY